MLIGVTGNIGSGKSTFCKFLRLKGFKVINGDELAKSFLKKGHEVYDKVVKTFGKEILNGEGEIDKKKLGNLVFNDKEKLEELTAIIHPFVLETIEKLKKKKETVFFEAAVIVEYGWQEMFDAIVAVYAYRGQRLLRAAKKFGLKNAILRDRMQLPYAVKFKYTDYLICNTKNLLHLKEQSERLIEQVTE